MAVVYAIECRISRFAYVGCTASSLNRRLNEHMYLLRKGRHSSEIMLADFAHYGRTGFTLIVKEKLQDGVSVEQRRESELRWMNHYKEQGRLYNASFVSFGPSGNWKERTGSPEARAKRSAALSGRPKHAGHGAKVSATKKALGQRPSAEAIRLSNKSAKRRRNTDEIVSSVPNNKVQDTEDKEPR